nr:MAG TPA: hypothetical protein [Caudoviricetes sp.]
MFILDSCPRYRPARGTKRRFPWWAIPLQFEHKKTPPDIWGCFLRCEKRGENTFTYLPSGPP